MIARLVFGSTRAVLMIGTRAFKFARNRHGARCNRFEAKLYASTRPAHCDI